MSKLNDLFFKFLRIRKVIKGLDKYIKQDIVLQPSTFGNDHASWTVITELLNENSVVYSFGVGDDISFDLCLINHIDLQILAFDPTPKSIDWVSSQNLPKQFVLHPIGLAAFNGKAKFHPPKNPNHISATMLDRKETKNEAYKVDVRTLKSIMQEFGHRYLDLLKMDIEGMEYEVIESMKETGIRPSQVLVEFHHRFKGVGVKMTIAAVNKMRQMGYKVFFISKTGEEISFIREDMIANIPEKVNE